MSLSLVSAARRSTTLSFTRIATMMMLPFLVLWSVVLTHAGFWLSALTFIEDGNKDFVPATTELTQPGSGISTSTSSSSLAARTPISTPLPSSTSALPTSSSTGAEGQPLLINFFKRSLAAEILRDIQQYQSQPYNLAKSRMVYDWLMKQLEYCDRTYDLDKLYNLSLQLEPREREEERITRMLHDSVGPPPPTHPSKRTTYSESRGVACADEQQGFI